MAGLLRRLFGRSPTPPGERTADPGSSVARSEADPPTRVVLGLGNPGPQYDATRHNVGWWVVDRLAADWEAGSFSRTGPALTAEAAVAEHRVLLAKPVTYMNRSGAALRSILEAHPHLDPAEDVLVVVDDATREPGRVRFRPRGSAGGHRGLRSVEAVLGSDAYARLRVGVGEAPRGADLSEWVLSTMPPEDEATVVELLPELTHAVEVWLRDGLQEAMNRFNR